MKLLLIAFCLVLLTTFSTNADVPKPKTPDKQAKQILHTASKSFRTRKSTKPNYRCHSLP